MTARTLLERKVDAGLTDLQTLLLLALAERSMTTLTDLAADLRRAVPSVSMAAQVLEESGYVVKDSDGTRFSFVFFYLSDEGKRKLAWLLKKD
jgi:DNA-binding MarR family transcriptional regulator